MSTLTINHHSKFDIKKSGDDNWMINEQAYHVKILKQTNNSLILRFKNKIYHVKIISRKPAQNEYDLLVNGRLYGVKKHHELEHIISKIGLKNHQKSMKKEVAAPMPGLISEIRVSEGQSVTENEPLLVLKAMKMENIIKSPFSGTIKNVFVTENSKIEKGALMVNFE